MSEIVLKLEMVYKEYRLGFIGADTMKDDIKLIRAKIIGQSLFEVYKIDGNYRTVG